MYDMNLPTVSFTQQSNFSSAKVVVVPYFMKDDAPISIDISMGSVGIFLPKDVGQSLMIPSQDGQSAATLYLCVAEKEKNIEQKIANAIAGLTDTVSDVAVNLGDIGAPFWNNISLNTSKLVSEIMVIGRNKWSAKSTNAKKKLVKRNVQITTNIEVEDAEVKRAVALGTVQSWIQKLVAMPANYLTPTQFGKEVEEFLETMSKDVRKKITFEAHDEKWVLEQKMGSFYSVAKGSREPLSFLEMHYAGAKKSVAPYVFVGKGVTFDTGGISIKPSKGMSEMKGDMAGAANACAALFFAALSGLEMNVVTLTPCCENMPDGLAVKPGDVVTAMNGKTIEIVNTDAEGRLILADALVYAQKFNGKYTIDLATLTGACITALGYEYTGLFSDEEALVEKMKTAGIQAKDWVWQLPMDDDLHKSMLRSAVADMSNSSEGAGGAGSTNGAIFLKEFAPKNGWVHLDIAGVSEVRGSAAPTGRPMPMLAQFLINENSLT